jgi:transcriptional regulator of nitric oxide reductase
MTSLPEASLEAKLWRRVMLSSKCPPNVLAIKTQVVVLIVVLFKVILPAVAVARGCVIGRPRESSADSLVPSVLQLLQTVHQQERDVS